MKQFMSIKDTATYSGLSQFYIRNRCKNGTIPHRMMGKKYMVDYEAFIEREHKLAVQSNLIKFMCEIGLISIESDKYRFNSRRAGGNFSKKYRYYYENEVRLIEYCKQEGIKEHLTKNCQKKNEEALPAYLMISPENIAFSSRVRLVKPKNVSVAGFVYRGAILERKA